MPKGVEKIVWEGYNSKCGLSERTSRVSVGSPGSWKAVLIRETSPDPCDKWQVSHVMPA